MTSCHSRALIEAIRYRKKDLISAYLSGIKLRSNTKLQQSIEAAGVRGDGLGASLAS